MYCLYFICKRKFYAHTHEKNYATLEINPHASFNIRYGIKTLLVIDKISASSQVNLSPNQSTKRYNQQK